MATKVVVRSAYGYDVDEASNASAIGEFDRSMTVQSSKDESDINVIVERFGVTGQLPQNLRAPSFTDFGETVFDFRSAVEAVALAEDAFMQMPAKVRAEFQNDPQEFLEFCSANDGAKFTNEARMRELGLLVPAKVPEPEKVMKVEVVNPPPKA